MTLKNVFILLYVMECIALQTGVDSDKLHKDQKQYNLVASFQEIIHEFPYLAQNVRPLKLAELIQKGGCNGEIELARFAIIDNQVYSYGKMKNDQRVAICENFLKSLVNNNTRLPDLYFILGFENELILQKVPKNSFEICHQTPLFILNKSGSSLFEKSKFLFPDPFKQTEYLTPEPISQFAMKILLKYAKYQQLSLDEQEKAEIKSGADIQNILMRTKLREDAKFSCITFEQTIETFPFIKENLNYIKILQQKKKGACRLNQYVQYIFIDNQVYCEGAQSHHNRTQNLTNLFKRISQKHILPQIYFIVDINDGLVPQIIPQYHKICRQTPLFVMNKNCSDSLEQTKFLLPDAHVIDGWEDQIKKLKLQAQKIKWEDKIKKAFFRGLASGPSYEGRVSINNMTNFKRYFHRVGYVQFSNERPDLIQARLIPTKLEVIQPIFKQIERRVGPPKNYLAQSIDFIEIFSKYRYLLAADGFGASWNRLPSILFSGSILLKPFSQKLQWFYDKMIPGVHYVSLREDLSDLIQKIEKMNQDDSIIKNIPLQAAKFADKYLTPEAIDNFTLEVFNKYAKIQNLVLDSDLKQKLRQTGKIVDTLIQQQQRNTLKMQIYGAMAVLIFNLIFFGIVLLVRKNRRNLQIKKRTSQFSVNQTQDRM